MQRQCEHALQYGVPVRSCTKYLGVPFGALDSRTTFGVATLGRFDEGPPGCLLYDWMLCKRQKSLILGFCRFYSFRRWFVSRRTLFYRFLILASGLHWSIMQRIDYENSYYQSLRVVWVLTPSSDPSPYSGWCCWWSLKRILAASPAWWSGLECINGKAYFSLVAYRFLFLFVLALVFFHRYICPSTMVSRTVPRR